MDKVVRVHYSGDIKPMVRFSDSTDQAKLKGIKVWLSELQDIERTHGFTAIDALHALAKLASLKIRSSGLPAGHSCPFAVDCLSKADRITGKITDGKYMEFRCYAASLEAIYKPMREMYWNNFDTLKHMDMEDMVSVIYDAVVAKRTDIMRIHTAGDYFNQKYFDAWLQVARLLPQTIFYTYTKSLRYWVNQLGNIPENFILNASRGGRDDYLIDLYNLKTAEVVYSVEEANAKGLEIDHDERHAILPLGNFALLIHGTQPKGSRGSDAIKELKANNIQFAYSSK